MSLVIIDRLFPTRFGSNFFCQKEKSTDAVLCVWCFFVQESLCNQGCAAVSQADTNTVQYPKTRKETSSAAKQMKSPTPIQVLIYARRGGKTALRLCCY